MAYAAKDNGGVCSFPYCGCWTDFNTTCLQVSNVAESATQYAFTLRNVCVEPLGHGCIQDIGKIEFNSCESTPRVLRLGQQGQALTAARLLPSHELQVDQSFCILRVCWLHIHHPNSLL